MRPQPTPAQERSRLGTSDLDAYRGRWLGYLYLAAAPLGPITLLVPHEEGYNDPGIVVVTIVAATLGAALVLRGARLGTAAVQALVALGSVLTAAVIDFTAGLPNAASLYFVWIVLFAFYFFEFRSAIAHLAFVIVLYALCALLIATPYPLVANTIAVAGTLLGAGFIVAVLRRRIETLLAVLVQTARTDELTGLPNRRAFNEELERASARAERAGAPLALAVLDIDRFKAVNDLYGHPTGDEVLRRLAAILRGSVREGDVAARIGGEEFAVVLPSCDRERATALAERLRRAVSAAFAEDDLPVTVSVGVAVTTPDAPLPAEELVRGADRGLYRAKADGRDRVVGLGAATDEAAPEVRRRRLAGDAAGAARAE